MESVERPFLWRQIGITKIVDAIKLMQTHSDLSEFLIASHLNIYFYWLLRVGENVNDWKFKHFVNHRLVYEATIGEMLGGLLGELIPVDCEN